ncbi:hypothetical protein FBQ87_07105 [Sphingobacteriales bacterium CHB3]|nr:hypothetical protein [Sphingobacteriales bacterium CHB3]
MLSKYRALRVTALAVAFLTTTSSAGVFSTALLAGYKGGTGFALSGSAAGFASGFPLAFEFTVGHARMDPGSAELARKIFINDATDGTPEKAGWMWDMQFDFLHPVRILGLNNANVYAGVRYSVFTANFKFVGGNEDFDVTSYQWGIGAGVKALFPMSRSLGFVVKTGVEHFFTGTLYGHDTSYSPNGEYVNRRRDYTFKEADAVVNQPKFHLVGMLGISYAF